MKGKGTILVPFVVLFLSLFLSQNLPAGGQLSVVSEQWSVNNNQSGRDEPQCKRQDNRESCIVNHASDNKSEIQNPQLEKEKFAQKTRKLQIPFIANSGHVDERVKFYANTFGGTVFVTKDGEIVYALPKHEKTEGRSQNTRSSVVDRDSKSEFQNPKSGIALREEFVGARVKAIKGEEKSVTKVNYFKGNDPSKWKTDISTYDMVNLGEIYKGIELKLKAYGDNIEKLFYVKPGADTERIRLRLSGGKDFNINNKGELEVETELGPVKFTKPVAYQEINGRRVEVSVEYRVESSEAENKSSKHKTCNSKLMSTNPKLDYGFRVASYDKSHDLIIDPLLASTFLGGSGDDTVKSIAIDSDGNVYVAGYTKSSDFPTTTGSYDTSYNGSYDTDDEDYDTDVFVSKLSGDLTSLLASTYLGGSSDDWVNSIAIDSGGNIYVTGETYATDFPTTTGSYDTSYNKNDAFVSKLNGDLTTLLASTYLGGSSDDWVNSIAIDSGGNIYVTGGTYATDFPTTTGAYDISYNGVYDAFVSKFSSNLTSLIASTYLGEITTILPVL